MLGRGASSVVTDLKTIRQRILVWTGSTRDESTTVTQEMRFWARFGTARRLRTKTTTYNEMTARTSSTMFIGTSQSADLVQESIIVLY